MVIKKIFFILALTFLNAKFKAQGIYMNYFIFISLHKLICL